MQCKSPNFLRVTQLLRCEDEFVLIKSATSRLLGQMELETGGPIWSAKDDSCRPTNTHARIRLWHLLYFNSMLL